MGILEIKGLTCRFGGLLALDRVDLEVREGELAGLIGPNGAGKTTCFNLITGQIVPTAGEIYFQGQLINAMKPYEVNRLGIARTFQNIRLFEELSVRENVMVGFHGRLKSSFVGAVLRLPGYRREEQQIYERTEELLDLVGLGQLGDELAANLAYGQQRLVEIARALATQPKLLLLDEPAAGMNPQETAQLAELVARLKDEMGLSILLIEHDMRFVMKVCERITVLDHGKVIARGSPAEVQNHPAVIEAYLGSSAAANA